MGRLDSRGILSKPDLHHSLRSICGGEVVVAHAVFEVFCCEVDKETVLVIVATSSTV